MPQKKERKKIEKEEKKEEKLSEREALRKLQEAIDKLTVKDIVTQMIVDLSALAYKKLGLPEETNKKYRDLNQAKQAINCLSSLVDTLEPDFTPDELRTYKSVVANLKIAYVSQSKTKTED